jgi:hypothetical protein
MPKRVLLAVAAALSIVAACGSAASSPSTTPTAAPTPLPTVAPTPTPAPTPSASAAAVASGDPFADQPYAITLPTGWNAFDVSNLDQASLQAFTKANPTFAGPIQAFASLPNARLAVNPLLANAMVVITLPSQGLSLDTIGQSFTAQFQNVPGITSKPTAKPVTLPAGPALHWPISLSVKNVNGAATKIDESVYLLANDQTALMVVFVGPGSSSVDDEQAIVNSLRFK